MDIRQLAFAAFAAFVCLMAAVRGGAPERLAAAGFVVAFVVTTTNPAAGAVSYRALEWRVAAIDAALLLLLLFIAIRSARFWPMPMASMQMLGVLGHFAKALDENIVAVAYYIVTGLMAWPMVALLLAGVLRHRARLNRFGVDFAWNWQLPRAYRDGFHAHERTVRRPGTGAEGSRPGDE